MWTFKRVPLMLMTPCRCFCFCCWLRFFFSGWIIQQHLNFFPQPAFCAESFCLAFQFYTWKANVNYLTLLTNSAFKDYQCAVLHSTSLTIPFPLSKLLLNVRLIDGAAWKLIFQLLGNVRFYYLNPGINPMNGLQACVYKLVNKSVF